jgi:hypothetical protein
MGLSQSRQVFGLRATTSGLISPPQQTQILFIRLFSLTSFAVTAWPHLFFVVESALEPPVQLGGSSNLLAFLLFPIGKSFAA